MEFQRAVEESVQEAGYGPLKVKQKEAIEAFCLVKIHLWLSQRGMANLLYMLFCQVFLTN